MDDTDSELLAHLDAAATGFGDRLRMVPPTHWDHPTPCTEWNVSQLVDHMIQGNDIYVAMLRGASAAEFMARLGQEVGHDDPVTAYEVAVEQCRAAFRVEGALDRIVDYPFGPVPGRQLLGLYVVDAVVHTWDLARAVGLDEHLDPKTVRWILDNFEWIYHEVSESPLTDGHRYYGPHTHTAVPATSQQVRLLHMMGREP
ncbi:TIGR03086 family metal-binding protein [Nocardia arthritidis]|uniref:TIGR03086 family protein n=1 Tax=Nocardia arthritidis TaxID=228602 RepID=A0A6G9Y908_9NOCA|nr:TIGR03086 family metal-binding protein [Nocardia arthritidis]QIS09709.1 TIGR03086 family protein [Nocardia arthritidis]